MVAVFPATPVVTRAGLARAVLVIICLVVPTTSFCVVRSHALSDGTSTVSAGHPRWGASGILVTGVVGHESALVAGDRVTAIDGRPISAWIRGSGGGLHAGDVLTYEVRRPQGGTAEVRVMLRSYDLGAVILPNWPLIPLVALLDLMAALVFLRRPREPSAWAILLLAVLVPLTAFEWPAGPQVVDLVGGQGAWPYLIGDGASACTWATLLTFAVVFPRPWRRLRTRPGLVLSVIALAGLVPYLVSLPAVLAMDDPAVRLARELYVSAWYARTYPVAIVAGLVSGFWRAVGADERRGMTWVLAGFGAALFGYLVLFQIPYLVTGSTLVPPDGEALLLAPIPLSVGAGVLRYRLIDIGLIIKRSFVRAGATVTSLGVVIGAMWLLSRPIHSSLLVFTLGGLIAAVVYSVRSRVQPVIVRRFFGDRDDPYRVVSRLGDVDTGAPAQIALTRTAETVFEALHLTHTAIDVTTLDGRLERVAEIGTPSGHAIEIDLRHGSDEVGRLGLDPGPGRERFGETDDRLLRDLARHVGAVVHAVRLNLDLQRSRENLILTREEERRRIRRDLHDGLGPTLAATAMQTEAARSLIVDSPSEAEEILDLVRRSVQVAVADIRRLVDDLRPPSLDQLGLLQAIRERVVTFNRSGRNGPDQFEVTVEGSGDLGALPAALEVAAYRITVEAVTNAARHSRASRCEVHLRRSDHLAVEIRDDGSGIRDGAVANVGLHSMRERAEELGGTCRITGAPGGGTIVRISFPTATGHETATMPR